MTQLTGDFVEFLRHRVALHTQLGSGFVHQVDGLVGQEPFGDITLGELYGGDAGIILYTHLVVVLVAFLQTSQDRDGRELVGLVHHDRLEASLQGLVLFEVFLIFVQGRCTDGPQLPSRQCRLEDVGGIHGTFATAGTHEGVYLVDEKDDVAVAARHLLDDGLQTLLKLTLVFCTGHQCAHVEREELLVLQVLWYVAAHDTLGQSFDDSRLTRARLTDENRVVLRAP